MMLANQGLRLPTNFDVTQLMSKGKETKTSHNTKSGTSKTKYGEPPKNKGIEISQNTPNKTPPNNLVDDLAQKMQALQKKLRVIQRRATKMYYLEDICPYLFDRTLNLSPKIVISLNTINTMEDLTLLTM